MLLRVCDFVSRCCYRACSCFPKSPSGLEPSVKLRLTSSWQFQTFGTGAVTSCRLECKVRKVTVAILHNIAKRWARPSNFNVYIQRRYQEGIATVRRLRSLHPSGQC